MGTKVGLTGITFGDASVQNTAAVTGVTSLTAGSGISLSGSTGAVTVTNSAQGATYSAGNGLSLSSTTFSVACPSFNSVGSYVYALISQTGSSVTYTTGQNLSAGTGQSQVQTFFAPNNAKTNNLSGTWRYLNGTGTFSLGPGCVDNIPTLICRVS
jgi:hypothetical protein